MTEWTTSYNFRLPCSEGWGSDPGELPMEVFLRLVGIWRHVYAKQVLYNRSGITFNFCQWSWRYKTTVNRKKSVGLRGIKKRRPRKVIDIWYLFQRLNKTIGHTTEIGTFYFPTKIKRGCLTVSGRLLSV